MSSIFAPGKGAEPAAKVGTRVLAVDSTQGILEQNAVLYLVPLRQAAESVEQLDISIEEAVAARVPADAQETTLRAIRDTSLRLFYLDASAFEFPFEILKSVGATENEIALLKAAQKILIFKGHRIAQYPPTVEIAARNAAAAFAIANNSVVVDLFVPRIVNSGDLLAPLPSAEHPLDIEKWVQIFASSSENGLLLTTTGLFRFSLPELEAVDVPMQLGQKFPQLMTALAAKLITESANPAAIIGKFAAPFEEVITADDIAPIYQGTAAGGATSIYLVPKHNADVDQFLIQPPPDYPRSHGEYLTERCLQLFEVEQAARIELEMNDEMAKAMETARATFPALLQRFRDNTAPTGAQLIVKIPIIAGNQAEFLWAYVSSLDQNGEMTANWGNDSQLTAEVRVGKQVILQADSVVDWALMVNDEMVEGGFTNQVLGH